VTWGVPAALRGRKTAPWWGGGASKQAKDTLSIGGLTLEYSLMSTLLMYSIYSIRRPPSKSSSISLAPNVTVSYYGIQFGVDPNQNERCNQFNMRREGWKLKQETQSTALVVNPPICCYSRRKILQRAV
jgi:hypothetical protein